MEMRKDRKKWEQAAEIIFYILVFAAITCFAMLQTYGDPPDEINRFKVVNFICRNGRLPHGADPEVILDGYGASYAFQPILTYIIQGFLLRFLKLFTADGYVLLLAARMVNVMFGVLMAYYVRRIAKEAWKNPYLQWVFSIMIVFLPQNIFIHSYVNTDSMAMLSVSIIFYVLLRAQRTEYKRNDCILLSVGIILCAMSYYNAYGIILAAIIIFTVNHVHYGIRRESQAVGKSLWIDYKPMLQKGAFIAGIVLVGIGWWFVRNGILYDGDIIAMNARRECAIQTAAADYNPLTRFTYQNSGTPLREMLFSTGYITLLRDSFIAMFGPMLIPTHGLIYIFYKRLWIVSCLAAFLPVRRFISLFRGKKAYEWENERSESRKSRITFTVGMALFGAVTIGLSIYYSYTWEYQPQGRYILPVLIPLMYLVTLGIQKICVLLSGVYAAGRLICLAVMAYVMLAFAYSLFDRFIPYYLEGENMFSMLGKVFVP